MPDPRFFTSNAPLAIGEALEIAGATLIANSDATTVAHAASLDESDLEGAVIYVDAVDKLRFLNGRRFGLCFAPKGAEGAGVLGLVAAVADPRAAFAAVATRLHRERRLDDAGPPPAIGVGARIHPTAIIGARAQIGDGAEIGAYAVIGPGVVIGAETVVAEGASVWCALIGARARIGPGCAVGGPGFGFAEASKGLIRVPQLGRVILEDEVEIGANCCIDRGALGDTAIGAATKIDNLVQIGHNVRFGRACILAAQVGVSGSAVVGDRVQFGGQAGIADHLRIGDGAKIAAKAGVISDVPAGETWAGYPARPRMVWLREAAAMARAARGEKKAAKDGD